jgi:hypothetical protein
MIATGQRVAIEMQNHTMMPHPMHLHGHAFQVVAINGAALAGAVRDTVPVPPMGSVTIAFDADNPGRWAFHCHNLYHMMTGMISVSGRYRRRMPARVSGAWKAGALCLQTASLNEALLDRYLRLKQT